MALVTSSIFQVAGPATEILSAAWWSCTSRAKHTNLPCHNSVNMQYINKKTYNIYISMDA